MRYSLSLCAVALLVPAVALADDNKVSPTGQGTSPVPTAGTLTIERRLPDDSSAAKPSAPQPTTAPEAAAPQPTVSQPAAPQAEARLIVVPPSAAPRTAAPRAEAGDQPEDTSGYVVPHFVPYLGGRIPDYAHIETKPNLALLGSGSAILGTAYFISMAYALSTCGAQMDCRSGSGWLYVPVVGPFVTAAQSQTTGGAALAAFDGSMQVLGAVLAIASVAAPRKFVVWQDKTTSISVAPTSSGPTAAGLAVTITNL